MRNIGDQTIGKQPVGNLSKEQNIDAKSAIQAKSNSMFTIEPTKDLAPSFLKICSFYVIIAISYMKQIAEYRESLRKSAIRKTKSKRITLASGDKFGC